MTKNPPTKKKEIANAVSAAIVGAVQAVMLHPSRIAPSPTNPRKTFPEGSLLELAASMKADGQVQAVIVRPMSVDAGMAWNKAHPEADGGPPEYELVVGERRWRSATLGDFDLRAEIRELSDLEVVRIQIIENLHREEVHPLEEAEGYEFLLKHSKEDISIDQVAEEVGKSKSYIYQRMRLAALCPDARKAFYAGDYDASTALLIARLPTPGLQVLAIEAIKDMARYNDGGASYRQIRSMLAQRFHLQLSAATFDITSETLLAGCGSCTSCPKRTGNQPMLFADVDSADVCTDPDCFADKKLAAVAQVLDQARAKGLRVIEGDEAKEMKPRSWQDPAGFVNLDEEAYEDGDGKSVTYADLMEQAGKKAPKAIVFVDPHGREGELPDMLITDEEAKKLAAKYIPKEFQEEQQTGAGSGSRAKPDPEWKRQQREREIDDEYDTMLIAAIHSKADKPRTSHDIILMIFAMLGDDWDTDEWVELAGGTAPGPDDTSDPAELLYAALLKCSMPRLSELALQACLEAAAGYEFDAPRQALEDAATAHKVNIVGMRAKAAEKVDNPAPEDDGEGDDE